jgi:hypothetical protein
LILGSRAETGLMAELLAGSFDGVPQNAWLYLRWPL